MQLTEHQYNIMKSRYALSYEETWEEVAERVSTHIAKAETNGNIIKWKEKFYDIMKDMDFLPGGRILYGAGRKSGAMLNCFALEVEDNRYSIAKFMGDSYLIGVSGGGLGANYSKIRPKNAAIQGTDGLAPGAISEIKKIDSIGNEVKSGGARRTALLACLDISHPDIMDFLKIKLDENQLNNHNISILITNDFLKAVKLNKDWYFQFNGIRYGEPVNARELWNKILSHSIDKGEPGLLFKDTIEKNFNTSYFQSFVSTNPCQPKWATVLTKDGVKQFKDIDIGDFIWSKEGWTKIVNKQCTGFKNVWKYKTSYPDEEYGTFYGTKNHRIVCNDAKIEVGLADAIDIFVEDYNKDTIDDYPWVYSIEDSEATKRTMRFQIDFAEYVSTEEVYSITVDNDSHTYWSGGCNVSNCGEIPLPNGGSCCLGAINLSNMYDEINNDVDWKKLKDTIHIAIRFLDNVITMNKYPLDIAKIEAEKSRRVGLGIMGLHYLLIKLGLKYGKPKSLEFIERLFTTFRNECYEASIELAKDKTPFSEYNYDSYSENYFISKLPPRLLRKLKKYGIRNAVVSTIAPTGTLSQLANVSSGIEPIYSPIHKRRYRADHDVIKEEIIVDKLLYDFYIDKKPLHNFVGAYDITPEEHIAVQAAAQSYIDSSISKTVNLPNDYNNVEELTEIVFSYSKVLKGLTFYRAGSRGQEPLTEIKWDGRKELSEYIEKASNVESIESRCRNGVCEL